jgi:FAD/FMN-containing dehydrogenase
MLDCDWSSAVCSSDLLSFDEATGVLRAEAGVSLAQLVRDFGPRGFLPLITPGTKAVTLGGCIANDVHGKAHHAQGSFLESVSSFRVVTADGQTVTASRDENADLFFASFGGMGLLGVITEVTLRLRRVETTYFRQRAIVVRSLDEQLDALEEHDATFPYSVAYVDPLERGASFGRGVLTVGDHARLDELPPALRRAPHFVAGKPKLVVPFELPELTLNPLTIRVVNQVIQRVLRGAAPVSHAESFFYPLDAIDAWNRGYGKRGFIQYQFVVPLERGREALRSLLRTIVESDQLPFLNILKRLGPANAAPLSFPMQGWTFAIDFPVRAGLVELTRRLDAMVADAGGRTYLGKDSYLEAATFRRMWPRLDEWLAVKRRWDPRNLFTSDLARRLELIS